MRPCPVCQQDPCSCGVLCGVCQAEKTCECGARFTLTLEQQLEHPLVMGPHIPIDNLRRATFWELRLGRDIDKNAAREAGASRQVEIIITPEGRFVLIATHATELFHAAMEITRKAINPFGVLAAARRKGIN